jgi:hypothetical protein
VDAEKILTELPGAHVLHVVRNPWSAYADTKKRPVPLSLDRYLAEWCINQYYALTTRELFPDRTHILRLEDILADSMETLGRLCDALGLERAETLRTPSWNGTPLEEVYPWGTIREATPERNRATAAELSPEEQALVRIRAQHYLDILDYGDFV